jgi:hypothetical protein
MLRFSCGVVAFFAGTLAIRVLGGFLSGGFAFLFVLIWGAVVTASVYTVLLALLGLPQGRPAHDESDHPW